MHWNASGLQMDEKEEEGQNPWGPLADNGSSAFFGPRQEWDHGKLAGKKKNKIKNGETLSTCSSASRMDFEGNLVSVTFIQIPCSRTCLTSKYNIGNIPFRAVVFSSILTWFSIYYSNSRFQSTECVRASYSTLEKASRIIFKLKI